MHPRQDGAPVLYTPPKNQSWEGYHWDLREGSGRMPNDAVQGLRFRPEHRDTQRHTETHRQTETHTHAHMPSSHSGQERGANQSSNSFLMSLDIQLKFNFIS